MTRMTPGKLLTSAEAAELLGITREHVARLARNGLLTPHTRAGGTRGAYLFHPREIDRASRARHPKTGWRP